MEKLYYTLNEAAQILKEQKSTIKYWEKEFPNIIKPHRFKTGGDRHYSKRMIEQIKVVQNLLRQKKLTIEGAKAELSQKKDNHTIRIKTIEKLKQVKSELIEIYNNI